MKIQMLVRVDVMSRKAEVVQASFKTLELPLFDKKYRYEIQEIELAGELPKNPNAIYWETENFEEIASLIEKGNDRKLFDRSKFEWCLNDMIRNRDELQGIGYQDIEEYLEVYCKWGNGK